MTAHSEFRGRTVFEYDFPAEKISPPLSYLDLKDYNIKKYIKKTNSRNKYVQKRLLTEEDRLFSTRFNQYSNDYDIHNFKYDDDTESINRGITRRGYEYYNYTVSHERYIFSVSANLRDIETFANIPGLPRGLLYRSGCFHSDDPETLLQVLQNVLQLRSIIDLRYFTPIQLRTGDSTESVTRQLIYKHYHTFLFDGIIKKWIDLSPNFDSMRYRNIEEESSTSLIFKPSVVQNLEIEVSSHNMYCFNIAIPNYDPLEDFSDFFSFINKYLRKIANYIIPNRFTSFLKKNNAYNAYNYLVQLILSGGYFFKAILETLLWIELPVAIVSLYGRHRVSIISIFILSILGANDEAIITDYCATEGALSSYGVFEKYHLDWSDSSLANTARDILAFIRNQYGSVHQYLTHIGFNSELRMKLKSRFIRLSNTEGLQYTAPPDSPFWTENPSIMIPEIQFECKQSINPLFLNESMKRISRVEKLIQLQDHFSKKYKTNNNVYYKKMLTKLENIELMRKMLDNSINATSLNLSVEEMSKKRNQLKKQFNKIVSCIKKIILSRQIISVKLSESINSLSRLELTRFFIYHNTKLYANKTLKGLIRRTPNLYDFYLDHPQLFNRIEINSKKDVMNLIVEYYKKFNHGNKMSQVQKGKYSNLEKESLYDKSIMKDTNLKKISSTKKNSQYRFMTPPFFYHEMKKKKWKNNSDLTNYYCNSCLTSETNKYIPRNFGEWLMNFWLVPSKKQCLILSLEVVQDECFVLPSVLAIYVHHMHHLNLLQVPISKRSNNLLVSNIFKSNAKYSQLFQCSYSTDEPNLTFMCVFLKYLKNNFYSKIQITESLNKVDFGTHSKPFVLTTREPTNKAHRYDSRLQLDPMLGAPSLKNESYYIALKKWNPIFLLTGLINYSRQSKLTSVSPHIPTYPEFMCEHEKPTQYNYIKDEMVSKQKVQIEFFYDAFIDYLYDEKKDVLYKTNTSNTSASSQQKNNIFLNMPFNQLISLVDIVYLLDSYENDTFDFLNAFDSNDEENPLIKKIFRGYQFNLWFSNAVNQLRKDSATRGQFITDFDNIF